MSTFLTYNTQSKTCYDFLFIYIYIYIILYYNIFICILITPDVCVAGMGNTKRQAWIMVEKDLLQIVRN